MSRAMRCVLPFAVVALAVACTNDGSEPLDRTPGTGPGTQPWESNEVGCENDTDCAPGEKCGENKVCQLQPCIGAAYSSVPPLGETIYFHRDRELIVINDADNAGTVDTYEPHDNTFLHPPDGKLALSGQRAIDVAGGNVFGTRPESVIAAIRGSFNLQLITTGGRQELPLTFEPMAVAAGDLNGNGREEIVALAASGEFAVCNAVDSTCTTGTISSALGMNATPWDVTVGDIDADGSAEAVFLVQASSEYKLIAHNFNADLLGETPWVSGPIGDAYQYFRITAGDIDGDRIDEVLALDIDPMIITEPYYGTHLYAYGLQDDAFVNVAEVSLEDYTVDIMGGDLDDDNMAEVSAVTTTSRVQVYTAAGTGSLHFVYSSALSSSQDATRIAMVDFDGDSPQGTLITGPDLSHGTVVPLTMMTHPPYDREHSDGDSSVFLGGGEAHGESTTETVTIGKNLTVSVGGDIIPSVLGASVSAKLGTSTAVSIGTGRTLVTGVSMVVNAKPEIEGIDNGAVVLGCGCYHAYSYEVHDPLGKLEGASSDTMDVHIPVDGQTIIMSIKRYNAMAEALNEASGREAMPKLTVPYRTGDVKSYPTAPETIDGSPIPEEDLVWMADQEYRVSDTSSMGWRYILDESVTNSTCTSTTIGAGISAKLGFVTVAGDISVSQGVNYSVNVNKSTLVFGSVPPIRDNPSTPEDEFKAYAYSFTPLLYRQHYKDSQGNDAAYYVWTYFVGQ